jgi:hypothetical protein
MTDEFLTQGLQQDRYLKALRLAEQFQDEITTRLFDFDEAMVDVQPGLFDSEAEPDANTNTSPSNGLALHRINHAMNGPEAPEDDQRLNVHLYWMSPTDYDRRDIDSAVRGFGYKIKYGETDADEWVAQQTRGGDWSLQTADNPYDSNTVFYRHVSSAAEIDEAADELIEHFSEYGDAWAANPDD